MTEIAELTLEVRAMRRDQVRLMRLVGERLNRAQVLARLGDLHRNTLATWVKDGRFPAPTPDGAWLLADVLEWEAGR